MSCIDKIQLMKGQTDRQMDEQTD